MLTCAECGLNVAGRIDLIMHAYTFHGSKPAYQALVQYEEITDRGQLLSYTKVESIEIEATTEEDKLCEGHSILYGEKNHDSTN